MLAETATVPLSSSTYGQFEPDYEVVSLSQIAEASKKHTLVVSFTGASVRARLDQMTVVNIILDLHEFTALLLSNTHHATRDYWACQTSAEKVNVLVDCVALNGREATGVRKSQYDVVKCATRWILFLQFLHELELVLVSEV